MSIRVRVNRGRLTGRPPIRRANALIAWVAYTPLLARRPVDWGRPPDRTGRATPPTRSRSTVTSDSPKEILDKSRYSRSRPMSMIDEVWRQTQMRLGPATRECYWSVTPCRMHDNSVAVIERVTTAAEIPCGPRASSVAALRIEASARTAPIRSTRDDMCTDQGRARAQRRSHRSATVAVFMRDSAAVR